MRRLTSFLIAFAAAMAIGGAAKAATIVFETVAAPAAQVGTTCPAPCFNVRMFIEDATRSVEYQAIQFDVAVASGGTAATLPVPGGTNPTNVLNQTDAGRFANGTTFAQQPWNLSATVGKSPAAGFDALIVHASDTVHTVNSIAAIIANDGCLGPNCTIWDAALAANRIYLGRFNATLTGTSFRIANITGEGGGIAELQGLNGATLNCVDGLCRPGDGPPPVPEPVGVILLGATLAGLGIARRR